MGVPSPASVKAVFVTLEIPVLSKIPVIGPTFFEQDIFIYFGYLITILASLYLWRTKKGLNLKAVGENAAAADASGINVNLYKYVHIILGGALCGLGGAYMSLVTIPLLQYTFIHREQVGIIIAILPPGPFDQVRQNTLQVLHTILTGLYTIVAQVFCL